MRYCICIVLVGLIVSCTSSSSRANEQLQSDLAALLDEEHTPSRPAEAWLRITAISSQIDFATRLTPEHFERWLDQEGYDFQVVVRRSIRVRKAVDVLLDESFTAERNSTPSGSVRWRVEAFSGRGQVVFYVTDYGEAFYEGATLTAPMDGWISSFLEELTFGLNLLSE